MRKQKIRQQKEVIFVFCEGLAEMNLFRYLKQRFDSKTRSFKLSSLDGIRGLSDFRTKYQSSLKKIRQQYGNNLYQRLFIIDNDILDSKHIITFLKQKSELVQLCNPNTEALLLSLVNKIVSQDVLLGDYSKKCKKEFKSYFGCTADCLRIAVSVAFCGTASGTQPALDAAAHMAPGNRPVRNPRRRCEHRHLCAAGVGRLLPGWS